MRPPGTLCTGTIQITSGADPHHFDVDADADPTFYLDAEKLRIQIRILLFTLILIRILFHFDADPKSDPTFHSYADPDPTPHLSDANLRLLAYGPSTAPCSASTTLDGYFLSLQASIVPLAVHGFIFSFLRSWTLTSVKIQIQLLI
jgi:hypothetical protein